VNERGIALMREMLSLLTEMTVSIERWNDHAALVRWLEKRGGTSDASAFRQSLAHLIATLEDEINKAREA
jgi:hypothetical protein